MTLSDPVTDIPPRLRALNNAQRGSFGEFLFSRVAREKLSSEIETTRRNRADFVVGGVQVDVKATIRDLREPLRPLKPYRGTRVEGISYAQVEFAAEGARVSLETELLAIIPWPDLAVAWDAWRENTRTERVAPARDIGPLRDRIIAHFRDLGFSARVIYRTIQAQFRDESPANLLPSRPQPNGLTVYLDFADHRITESNIRRIIAFPDSAALSFPLLERTRLHRQKVDLAQLPPHFVFANLSELFAASKTGYIADVT